MKIERELLLGQSQISIETGRIAKQADGSVVVRCGDTLVLTTVCSSGDWTAPKAFRTPLYRSPSSRWRSRSSLVT